MSFLCAEDVEKVIDKEYIRGYNNQALARVLEW